MKKKMSIRCLLAMMLAVILAFSGTATTILAAEVSTEASYGISVREDIANGTVVADKATAAAGETVTLTVTPNDGYNVTTIGYWTVAEDGSEGDIVTVNVSESGTYSFTMPESEIKIGAVFQDSTKLQLVGTRVYEPNTTSNPLTFYAAFGDSYLYVNETGSWARVTLDARFFEEKYADDSMVFTFELRQNDAVQYYNVLGTLTFTLEEIKAMNPELNEAGTGYVFDIELPINSVGNPNNVKFKEGWYGYCYMAVTMDGWVDVKGQQASRYLNSSVDATILAEGANHLVPMVMLYNLSADTYTGYLFREYLKGEGITFLDITNDNLNQNIGYMAGWEGYESVSPEEAYNPDTYDFTYLLYCNLSEVQVDAVLDALHRDNISVKYSSVLKPYSASKSFSELTVRIQKEDEAFKARFALGLLLVEVDELVDADYENHEQWGALQEAWNNAYSVYTYDEELEAEDYIAARKALLEKYLAVTGKMQLAGKLELVLKDNGDGTYTVSGEIRKNEGDEGKDFKVGYNWFTGFERVYTETITVKAEDLYRISLTVSGVDTTYGLLAAELSAPGAVEFTTAASADTISVTVKEIVETMNMPEIQGYVAELYQSGELVEKLEVSEAGELVFNKLNAETEYTVKVYAYNLISHGTTQEVTVTTDVADNGNEDDETSKDETTDDETSNDGTTDDEASNNESTTNTGIGSVSGDGVPEGATLDVKELNATETKALLAEVEKKHKKFLEKATIEVIFNLNLLKDGKIVQPNEDGTVTVTLKLPEKLATSANKLGIIYIADDGSIEIIASNVKDGYITFTTDHFSNYAIYSYESAESPKTADDSYAVTWMLIMMLGVVAVAGTMKNRKIA